MAERKDVRVVLAREPEEGEVMLVDDDTRRTASVERGFGGLVLATPEQRLLVVDHPEQGGAATPTPSGRRRA